ncbi:calcium-binding protein [Microvirga sp. 2YAF29]|uniref:calcium-binding protein n=1 Tax=Microvirga sp. 2YAF29 TaxID=3233031 RepID=UPI003F95730C
MATIDITAEINTIGPAEHGYSLINDDVLNIANQVRITARGAAASAVHVSGGFHSIASHGILWGGYAGLSIHSAANVVNHLAIGGGIWGIPMFGLNGQQIDNRGSNEGGLGRSILGSEDNDLVYNKGTINGLMTLGAGNELFDGRAGRSTGLIVMGIGNASVLGSASDETFYGGLGDDFIDGGAGIDTVVFSSGADITVTLASELPQATGEGFDTLINIENIRSGSGRDRLTGNNVANVLDGGGGVDVLIGYGGDDTYVVDTSLDEVIELENQGIDQVLTTASYKLSDNIEVLRAQGSDHISLTGNRASNRIFGNDGNNQLDGGAGADEMHGGRGDDTYLVENAFDLVFEMPGEGRDQIMTTVSYILPISSEIEKMIAGGNDGIRLTGNNYNNGLHGNAGKNMLSGSGGRDTLWGGAGNDTLNGGKGKDFFVFDTKPSKANFDRITDFSVRDDSIYLDNAIFKALGRKGTFTKPSKLKSDSFWIGSSAHDNSDRLIYNKKSGVLFYDPDGIGSASQVMIAGLKKNLKLTYKDFFVI